MDSISSNVAMLSLFFGVFTVLIGNWYNQRLGRMNRIYSERREVYGRFLRAWWAIIFAEDITNELDLEYSHAKSLFAMHATPKAVELLNKAMKFIVKNNYLQNEFDQREFLNLIGRFLVQLRMDSGGKSMPPKDVLGLTYIQMSDLEANGVVDEW